MLVCVCVCMCARLRVHENVCVWVGGWELGVYVRALARA